MRKGRFDVLYASKLQRALRSAVQHADLVHTSNLFGNDTALYFAHDLATKLRKKTLFVVAEDFCDMLGWEWVRTAPSALQRWRRKRTLRSLDRAVRKRIANASLVFLHTPAAVSRYRLDASNAYAIRQPVHEREDVIAAEALKERCAALEGGEVLRIATASRMQPLKGLDMLVRAIALLRDRGVRVELMMYGGGPQQPELEQLAQRLQISDRVHFGGALAPGQELRSTLARHHLFSMPHLTTDFGRGFFDAISAGLPVLAFRSAASEDTVRDGMDGLLVPNADVESLASAIEHAHLQRTTLIEMSKGARERALRNTRCEWNRLRAMWIADLFR